MSDLITVKGIRVSESGYAAAPKPIDCPGHDDGTDCEDDSSNPCKACFLYDEDAGESRYWWDHLPEREGPNLYDADTNEWIGYATREQVVASGAAANKDGGSGIIRIDRTTGELSETGRRVYTDGWIEVDAVADEFNRLLNVLDAARTDTDDPDDEQRYQDAREECFDYVDEHPEVLPLARAYGLPISPGELPTNQKDNS